VFQFTKFDYEYLTGFWDGPPGAAFNVVAEDCMEAGWGYYGHPTELGQKLMLEFEKNHVHSAELISAKDAANEAAETLSLEMLGND
jgi:hypothetical protein